MKNLIKVFGNAVLVVGGFFLILFSTSKFSSHKQPSLFSDTGDGGVAHADVPYSQGSYSPSGDAGYSGGDGGDGDGGK